ncbi:hypothetical protein L9F63_011409, partial [Diploptera punctata]
MFDVVVSETSPSSESLANCLENLRTASTTLVSLQRIKNASLVFHPKPPVVSPSGRISAQNGMRSSSPSPSAPPDYSDSLRRRKVHRCDVAGCDKVYTKSSHLKAHKRTHTDIINCINSALCCTYYHYNSIHHFLEETQELFEMLKRAVKTARHAF